MTKAQSVKRGITSVALLSALVISGCSSSDPNANIPAPVKMAGAPEQALDQTYKKNAQTGPEILMSAGQNNGSYNNMRRSLVRNNLPEKNSIQLSEWVNFFPYDYPQPKGRIPLSALTETSQTPWNQNTKLLRIAVKSDDIKAAESPAANLVVFIGTNGSDLALIKQSLTILANQLSKQDNLSIITTSGDKSVLLAPTSGAEKAKLLSAISNISRGKAEKDGERITQAYTLVKQHYIQGGINRVIIAGNSNFKAGFTGIQDVQNFFNQGQIANISLTTIGFGVNKFQPSSLAQIAYEGNGVYAYIDNQRDAEKLWNEQLNSTQTFIAKNFAINAEFNSDYVKAYRLLGYQSERDNGSANKSSVVTGQTLTALYEIVPIGSAESWSGRFYGPVYTPNNSSKLRSTTDMAVVHIRYKQPNGSGQLIELPVPLAQMQTELNDSSKDFRFAAAVAAFAQQLKDNGATTGQFTLDDTLKLANDGKGSDQFGLHSEFIQLVESAQNQLPSSSPIKGKEK